MSSTPAEIHLNLRPRSRFDLIDVSREIESQNPEFHDRYDKALYCSYHTTAGYLDQGMCGRLNHSEDCLQAYLMAFQQLFPPDGPYQHDKIHLRSELSAEQRLSEPRNADSHLTFIGSGLKNCATYPNTSDLPVYFIDLDGINGDLRRCRQTSIIGFNSASQVDRMRFAVPVSRHRFDSINLTDPRIGLFQRLESLVKRHGLVKGHLEIALDPDEQHAGLTVNEYETLLMKHDLAEVLRNPVRFMAEKGRNMLVDPWAIPNKTINYAKYDFVHVLNELVDAFGISDSTLEHLIDRFLTVTAKRFLRLKRSVRIPISDRKVAGEGTLLQGTYQSPILIQWDQSQGLQRKLDISFTSYA